jgi:hypothetical protein
MTPSTRHVPRLAASIIVTALVLAACGDDDDAEPAATEPAAPVTEPPVEETAAATVEVVAFDYGYNGIPDTVEAGTVFTLVNTAPAELHEFVALRLPDDEARPVSELVTLPIEELGAILAVEPAAVLLALPDGGQMIPAVGDGTLAEPGRYAIICMIPEGADPQGYLDAAAASEGGPPEVDGGPPHIALGMFAEVTVT